MTGCHKPQLNCGVTCFVLVLILAYILVILCSTFLYIIFCILVVITSLLMFVNTFLASPLYKFSTLRSFVILDNGLEIRTAILRLFLCLFSSCLYVYFKLARRFLEKLSCCISYICLRVKTGDKGFRCASFVRVHFSGSFNLKSLPDKQWNIIWIPLGSWAVAKVAAA